MEHLQGHIERITFQSEESGFTVAQLHLPGRRDLVTIVGSMPGLQPGETVHLSGEWKRHLIHGQQFEVTECRTEMPADALGMTKYLGSGLIKGIGPVYAQRIVEHFGSSTLEIIDITPRKLLEVAGIGATRLKKIMACWDEQKAIREVMIFLQRYGVSPAFAQKIFKRYGSKSIDQVSENPYSMAREIRGIGFKTADTIAAKMGHRHDSPQRILAGIEHVLSELSDEGHVCYPVELFIPLAEDILEVPQDLIREQQAAAEEEGRVVSKSIGFGDKKQEAIWRAPLYHSEMGITRELQRLWRGACRLRTIDTSKAIAWAQQTLSIQLAPRQYEAVEQALHEKIQIITGGPGTGKSTITNAILRITEYLSPKIVLAAPTGRAAKRMTEITGRKASTIHSLLEYDFRTGGFKRNRETPLDCDLLVVDEASMIDTLLMYHLLRAIPSHSRVIFVGDINQLPSVGPGNVLQDMIFSKRLAVTMLNEIFRQAAGSRIITNAHAINDGVFPDLSNEADSDFFFIDKQEPEQVLNTIVELVSKRLPNKYGLDPISQIQVLAPMKRGVVGTENLNVVLQERLNPSHEPLVRAGRTYHVGDKVMQMRNDYQKEVYNGDVGVVEKIDAIDQQLMVNIDGRSVVYDFGDLDDLVLAYAVSIHKYQGSECPCIVMPVHTTHFKLLHRNLLYTGVTRGKQLVVLVGTKKALAIAIRNDEVKRRYTNLRQTIATSKK